MKHRKLFPFKNRKISLSDFVFDKSKNSDPATMALIAISNLKVGDTLKFKLGSIEVTLISNDNLTYLFKGNDGNIIEQTVTAQNIPSSPLQQAIEKEIIDFIGYHSEVSEIIERDPVVYRLATGNGWILNHDLSLLTGNVLYDKVKTEDVLVTHTEEVKSPVQAGFDF